MCHRHSSFQSSSMVIMMPDETPPLSSVTRFDRLLDGNTSNSHFNALSTPNPCNALQPIILHGRLLIDDNDNIDDILSTVLAVSKSCLFANTSNGASTNATSFSRRCNSLQFSS